MPAGRGPRRQRRLYAGHRRYPEGDVCSPATGAPISMTGKNIGDLLTAANVSWGWFQGGFDLTVRNPNGMTGCFCRTTTSGGDKHSISRDYDPGGRALPVLCGNAKPEAHAPNLHCSRSERPPRCRKPPVRYARLHGCDRMPANMPVSFLKARAYQDAHPGHSGSSR